TSSFEGTGVRGVATATTGVTYGMFGGVYSTTDDARGAYGRSYGTTGLTYGVYGRSDSNEGIGVYGIAGTTNGISYGVYGVGNVTNGCGVYGEGNTGGKFVSTATANVGVRGYGDGAGGYFEDPGSTGYAYIGSSTYKVAGNGTVNFVQNHPSETNRVIVYACPEGDEVATYTRGTARLSSARRGSLWGRPSSGSQTRNWDSRPM
ncbi:MAG: hypothetical protein MUE60_09135, partial [Candidatus Eisenbacteria bacterium]|nr:hypothetical protein [Candidatus Eisenbacteria bacterium]